MTTPGNAPEQDSGFWTPRPDPTVLTTEAVARATDIFRRELQALRELLDARLGAMDSDRDRLRDLVEDVVRRFTAALDQFRVEVDHRDSANRQLVEQRLNDLDTARASATTVIAAALASEREYIMGQIANALAETRRTGDVAQEKFAAVDALFASNALALAAALAAQEKAVAAQNDSNTLAIRKSEDSTKETIAANLLTAQTGLSSLANQVSDVKDRVVRIESTGAGAASTRTDQRLNIGTVIAALATLVAIVSLIAFALKK